MVSTFNLKNALLGLSHDIQCKACNGVSDEELLIWARNRFYRIKHEYKQFQKFNSKEYIPKKKRVI
jgi:hypothetical protein